MIYDPEKLPFWEIARGYGPYTDLRRRRAEWAKRPRKYSIGHDDSSIFRGELAPGCSWNRMHRGVTNSDEPDHATKMQGF